MDDLFSQSLFSQEESPDSHPSSPSSDKSFSDFLKNVPLDDEENIISNISPEPAPFPEYSTPYNVEDTTPQYHIPENFLDGMNPEQKEAVLYDEGSLLVLAGAGSGKTRVITHRFAHLVQKYDLGIHNILCVTFTNKAAGEMKERIGHLLGVNTRTAWVRTFHSMCTMILREHAQRIGFSQDFTIYDSNDTKNTIKKIMEKLNIDPKDNPDKAIARAISSAKEELISPDEMAKNARNPFEQMCAEIYKEYKDMLRKNQAMDFGDLIVNTIFLLENCPDVQERYHRQWRFIMADEFQDTNKPQYRLLCLLSRNQKNVCVVGDDDQSIYGWRGARVENIRQFQQEFNAHIIRLERNYRSHGNILTAANAVVKSIKGRMPKTLKAVREDGAKISFRTLGDDRLQAAFLYDEIEKLMHLENKDYKDFAVLYRTNAQSRILEEVFTRHRIPHKVYGGQRFFDRAEIKDILSYLRIIVNPQDSEAFDRIVNIPKRKIGAASLAKLQEFISYTNVSYADACLRAEEINGVGKALADSLINLGKILTELRDSIETTSPTDIIKILLDAIQYRETYLVPKYGTHEADDRFENIQELVNAVKVFEEANPNSSIADFLREASLLSTLNEEEVDNENVVSLMTIHSAKGLEFPIVFVVGVAEGIMPLSSSKTPEEMDEEKRLFYVAITRAMDKLYITFERQAMRYGEYVFNEKSHFIDAIPPETLDQKIDTTISRDEFREKFKSSKTRDFGSNSKNGYQKYSLPTSYPPKSTAPRKPDARSVKDALGAIEVPQNTEKVKALKDLEVGQKVVHTMWGKGVVEYVSTAMVKVNFESFNTQVLMGNAVSNLKKIID